MKQQLMMYSWLKCPVLCFVVLLGAATIPSNLSAAEPSEPKLLRKSYTSVFTKKRAGYWLYLPSGYEDDKEKIGL